MPRARANITVYRSTRFSGSSLILSCLTVSFCCGIVYSRVKRTPESEKKNTYVYLIKRKIKQKMLVYVPGTYIFPFVLALERGVNSNPSSRERLFLRTTNPRQDPNSYVHGWHEACCRTQATRPGAWSSSKPYFTQTIYTFPDRLVGGSDSAFVSTAAELKFNRNPTIYPPTWHRKAVQERTYNSR